MIFVTWLILGLALGPSILNWHQPSWFSQLAPIFGGLFLFLAGWEMRFLELRSEARFYSTTFIGCFVFPVLAGYFLLGQNVFLALAMGISALPVAIQILKEKGLYETGLARRVVTLASLCDVSAWILLAFLFPKKDLLSWISSHWIVFAFFAGLLVGRIRFLRVQAWLLKAQAWLLAPVFFVALGWKIDILQIFSVSVFLQLLLVSVVTKGFGAYVSSRIAGIAKQEAVTFAALLNARGAMEVLAAHYAFQAGLINEALYAGLVAVGVVTSLMAIPMIKNRRREGEAL